MIAALSSTDKKGIAGSKQRKSIGAAKVFAAFSTSRNATKTLVRDFLNPYATFHSGPEDSGQQHEEEDEANKRPSFFNGNIDGNLRIDEYIEQEDIVLNPFVDDVHANAAYNNEPVAPAKHPLCYTKEMKWTVALLK
jgi:hypothetical protein